MLVLKLRRGEVLTIGEARVQVRWITADWSEVSIEAPAQWPVRREPEMEADQPAA